MISFSPLYSHNIPWQRANTSHQSDGKASGLEVCEARSTRLLPLILDPHKLGVVVLIRVTSLGQFNLPLTLKPNISINICNDTFTVSKWKEIKISSLTYKGTFSTNIIYIAEEQRGKTELNRLLFYHVILFGFRWPRRKIQACIKENLIIYTQRKTFPLTHTHTHTHTLGGKSIEIYGTSTISDYIGNKEKKLKKNETHTYVHTHTCTH